MLAIATIDHQRRFVAEAPITSRTDIINVLIGGFGLERYLEIGVEQRANFDRILARERHSVDPAGSPTFLMPSDEFFARGLGNDQYDLVFIDGFHEAEQCLRDIENALARLSPSGFIVVHDVNPPTEWHQRPPAQYLPGTEWNGTVWRAIVEFRRRHPQLPFVTVDVDWGCGVIGAAAGRGAVAAPPALPDPGELTFGGLDQNRSEWLNLITVDAFRSRLLAEIDHDGR